MQRGQVTILNQDLKPLEDKIRRLPQRKQAEAVTIHYSFALPCRIRAFGWQANIDLPPCNECFALILNLKGNSTAHVEKTSFKLSSNQAFLIFPYQQRDLTSEAQRDGMGMTILFETANHQSMSALLNTPVALSPRALILVGWI